MIHYILALIFLIIIILYEVYETSESFTPTDASGNPIVATDASGNPIVATDASGNEIKLSVTDLFGLLGPFNLKTKATEKKQPTPAPADVESTPKSMAEIEERIAKSVAKKLKSQLAADRSTEMLYDRYAPCDITDAEAQGQEYGKDMSEYIRKDSIPCWNCSVP